MNCDDIISSVDLLRGQQASPGGADSFNQVEGSSIPQTKSVIQGKAGDKDGLTKEREKELEQWMEQVKAFIRKIDTNKL